MTIHWESKFETNIPEIDSQHQKLFKLLSNLENIFNQNQGQLTLKIKELNQTITDLEKYAVGHFLIEERIMEENSYPNLEIHKTQHNIFTDKIFELKKELSKDLLRQNELSLNEFTEQLIQFLSSWLTKHIMKEDMEYKPFIKHRL